MEKLEEIAVEGLAILKRIDLKTDTHGKELSAVKEGMQNVKLIAENTGKMATALEKVTDRAMTALEGKSKRQNWFYSSILLIFGVVLIIVAAAWTHSDFSMLFGKDGGSLHAGSQK